MCLFFLSVNCHHVLPHVSKQETNCLWPSERQEPGTCPVVQGLHGFPQMPGPTAKWPGTAAGHLQRDWHHCASKGRVGWQTPSLVHPVLLPGQPTHPDLPPNSSRAPSDLFLPGSHTEQEKGNGVSLSDQKHLCSVMHAQGAARSCYLVLFIQLLSSRRSKHRPSFQQRA